MSLVVGLPNKLTTHISLSPMRYGFAPGFVNYKKGCTRLAATNDEAYQDIADILLKVPLNTKNQSIKIKPTRL